MKTIHIAILAPLKRPITPTSRASRTRVLFDLISELIRKNYRVSVFGTGDSVIPGATLEKVLPKGLNFLPPAENPFYQHTAYLTMMIQEVVKRQRSFDLIHNHVYPEFLPLLALPALNIPMVTTIHAQLTPEVRDTFLRFSQAHLVVLSQAAKRQLSSKNTYVVHNGIDTAVFRPAEGMPEDYFLFVGRMGQAKDHLGRFMDTKGVQHAIAVSQQAGIKLKIVGNVEDPKFYETLVKPHLSKQIEFIGEQSPEPSVHRDELVKLYQKAKALLNPIQWEEPFGLVIAESMACGTPVIAFDRGSASELINDGKTGFVVPSSLGINGLIEAIAKIDLIDRKTCRLHAEKYFSKERMVRDYELIYTKILKQKNV